MCVLSVGGVLSAGVSVRVCVFVCVCVCVFAVGKEYVDWSFVVCFCCVRFCCALCVCFCLLSFCFCAFVFVLAFPSLWFWHL